VSPADLAELLRVDDGEWAPEVDLIEEFYARFGDRVPPALRQELEALRERLSARD